MSEITWKVVDNTVESRMINSSLIHKLVPCRKLKRRTKAMNTRMKQIQNIKTYSQYIKMKTSILRNVSDDSDTDDDESFTDDDYSIIYKSDISLANYVMNMSKKSALSCDVEINTSNNNNSTSNKLTKKVKTKNSNSRSSKTINVGWQDVIKKKAEGVSFSSGTAEENRCSLASSSSFPRDDIPEDPGKDLNISNNKQSFQNNIKEEKNDVSSISGTCIAKETLDSLNVADLNEVAQNNKAEKEIKTDANKSIEQPMLLETEDNEESQLDKNHSKEIIKSQSTPESVKRNLIFTLNDETIIQEFKEPSISKTDPDQNLTDQFSETHTDHNLIAQLKKSPNIKRKSVKEEKDKLFSSTQTLCNGNTNQPKDSGIDEDTEEEFPEREKKICKKIKTEIEEAHENSQSTSSSLEHENNSLTEITSLPFDSENHDGVDNDTLDKVNIENTISLPIKTEDINKEDEIKDIKKEDKIEDIKKEDGIKDIKKEDKIEDIKKEDKTEDQQNKRIKQKSQPRVTHTEVVKKRYRIVSCNTSLSDDYKDLDINTKHSGDEEVLEFTEADQAMDDSMSPLTKKRLQQLRRLNLTADSESSQSEDDDKYCSTENMRNKLLKRSKESSSNEDENDDFKLVLEESSKKQKRCKKSKVKSKEEEALCSNTVYEEHEKTSSSETPSKHMLKFPPRKDSNRILNHNESTVENFFRSVSHSDNEDNNLKSFDNTDLYSHKLNHLNGTGNDFHQSKNEKESRKINLDTETMTEIANKELRIQRPNNLQDFIEEENLVSETTIPSFKFKDIQDEDEVFVVDVPSVVFESELVGKRIILTRNKLKLGKQKYRIIHKDVDHVSCVFGTGKCRKPYKTVNIKPIARIVASEKIAKPSFKIPNQSDTISYTEDTSEAETDVSLSKKNSKNKHNKSFKVEN
ncbi:uncharacterized protein LOC143183877 [Calliopsis andreniformis]|uniref:uncharacterized protein LOC143183877 n=1 Tax=Calliopsis andreniformis TaxID=337506 RepID=UPI003FCD3D5C